MKMVRLPDRKNVPGYRITSEGLDGYAYHNKTSGLYVIQSVSLEKDNRYWLHTSYSRRNRIPMYRDTVFIKDKFIGKDEKAVMVFPGESEHVNIHPFCLHLWCCLDADPLPDFTHGMGTI